jgi:CheY-like chemotaxis protein
VNVLVAHTDPLVRRTVRAVLEPAGHDVREAAGRDAVKRG